MNDDNFERRLRSQPMRQVPTEWREEILANARVTSPRGGTNSLAEILTLPFRELIWPARRIWAGFAFTWLVIVIVNLADSDRSTMAGAKMGSPAAEDLMAWQHQQKLMAELMATAEFSDADKPKLPAPKPRSERQTKWSIG